MNSHRNPLRAGRPKAARAGGALLLSLVIVSIIASMGAVMVQSALSASRSKSVQTDTRRAFYLAEAGLSEAVLSVAQGKSGEIGTPEFPAGFANGLFWVESEEVGSLITLKSVGLAGVGRSCLSVTIRRQVNPIASLGFFSGQGLVVGAGTIVDGYDSRLGTFDSQVDPRLANDTTGEDGRLRSNGDISIEALPAVDGEIPIPAVPTYVYGDVSPGPEGIVTIDPGVTISGVTAPSKRRSRLASIDVPRIPSEGSPLLGRGLLIDGRQAAFDDLSVPAGATLKIVGPATVVIANLEVLAGGRVLFDTNNGPVTLHCLDNLSFQEGSFLDRVGTGGEPTAFLISTNLDKRPEALVIKQDVDAARLPADEPEAGDPTYPEADLTQPAVVEILATGTFQGILYSPLAELSIPNGLRVFGAIVASALTLEEGARVSFDQALVSSTIGSSALPQLISWQMVDLPDEPIVRSRIDPIIALRAAGYVPEKATNICKEDFIAIQYLDGLDTLNNYDGPYKDFDSARVVTVLGLAFYDPDVGESAPAVLPPPTRTKQLEAGTTDALIRDAQ